MEGQQTLRWQEGATMMQVRELVPVRVEVEVVTSRQERERRERLQACLPITQQNTVDWRSYERRALPARWRVR